MFAPIFHGEYTLRYRRGGATRPGARTGWSNERPRTELLRTVELRDWSRTELSRPAPNSGGELVATSGSGGERERVKRRWGVKRRETYGAAYGTAKSGVGVASMGVMRPELVMKSIVPVVMAGVLGIYGLIIAVIISTGINPKAKSYYLFDGYAHLSSGLACGLAGLAAGMAIGIVGDAGAKGVRTEYD
ncbi:UNVERIFIED_CONTAM: V-type proton ATPase subunit c1 [Sesamum latifolium]|uniref:V-type proton ATPase proteolipid subunit n=1 Tax=Sesamum latifolium TaxID=2727402 RepID=A0AAW2V106_9LAMI